MVTQNVAEYPSHYVTHGHRKFDVARLNGKGDAYKRKKTFSDIGVGIKVTLNTAQHPLHHVTYSPVQFKVAMSYSLERKYIKWPWPDLRVKVTWKVAQYPL